MDNIPLMVAIAKRFAGGADPQFRIFVGNGPLDTEAESLAGAVNELNASFGGVSFAVNQADGGLDVIYKYE